MSTYIFVPKIWMLDILRVGNLDVDILIVGNLDLDKRTWHQDRQLRPMYERTAQPRS
jgi:hypothetical protein